MESLLRELRRRKAEFEVDDMAVVPAGDALTISRYAKWIHHGYHGTMNYLDNAELRKNPSSVLSDVQSMLIFVLSQKRLEKESGERGNISRPQMSFPRPPLLSSNEDGTDNPAPNPDNLIPKKADFLNQDSIKIQGTTGQIIHYAGLIDYHQNFRNKLRKIGSFIKERITSFHGRGVVDTAPILEKEWAVRAGLGTIGRHSLLIHPVWGSRVFLGTLLLSIPVSLLASEDEIPQPFPLSVPQDEKKLPLNPHLTSQSGLSSVPTHSQIKTVSDTKSDSVSITPVSSDQINPVSNEIPAVLPQAECCRYCRRCIEVCPTGAIHEKPYGTLEARRCLNYWTIEYKEDFLPPSISETIGKHLIGCDLCQQVCPQNKRENYPPITIPLAEVQQMTEEMFQQRFSSTIIHRVGLERLKRNANWIFESNQNKKKDQQEEEQ
ncbi:MAG: DUF1730 domain-containing protein [Thermoguttaceae bacterium]|nr:DUF1730 domain-containing protein [Thermoguttaceae bacterium]